MPEPSILQNPASATERPKIRRGAAADDRGNPVPILNLRELKRAAESKDDRRAKLARYLRDALRNETRRMTPGRFAIAIGSVVVFVAAMIIRDVLASQGSLVARVPLFPIMCVAWALLFLRFRRSAARNVAVTAVAEGICGACTYSLQGIDPGADGCLVCPECGAAWRHERIVRPHWKDASTAMVSAQTYRPPWWKALILATPRSRDQIAPDDRGTFVRVLDAKLHLLDPKRRRAIDPAKLQLLRRSLFATGLELRIGLAVMPLLIAVLAFVSAALALPETIQSIVFAAFGLLFLLVTLATVLSRAFRGPVAVIRTFKQHGLCPCCAQSLAAAERDSAKLSVCSECRAAWRIQESLVSPTQAEEL